MNRNSINRNQRDINQSVNDRFDLIIKIHRFFGVTNLDVKNSQTKKKWKSILFILYQIVIYIALILNNIFIIVGFSEDKSLNKTRKITFYSILIISTLKSVLSSILFSIRANQLIQININMRSFIISLENNQIKSGNRLKNIRYFFYIFVIYLIALDLMISSLAYFKNNMFWKALIDIFFYVHEYSIDFYFIYLVLYVISLQKLFNDNLSKFNSIILSLSDVKYLKYKFLTIQSIISDITNVLSPILLIHCSSLIYQFIVSCYYCFKNIFGNDNIKYSVLIIPFYSLITVFSQLLIISLCAEIINKKVQNFIFQKKR